MNTCSVARVKFWEKKGDWLTPPLCILLLFWAAAVSEARGCKRPTQSTAYFGKVHCVHDLNLNIAPSRMGEMSCIKPVHWLFITWALSSSYFSRASFMQCKWGGQGTMGWNVSISFLCLSEVLSLDRNLMFWSVTCGLFSVCRLFRLVIKCLKDVVLQKYLPYPKKLYIYEYLGKLVKFFTFLLLEVCDNSFVCRFLPALCTTWSQITAAEIGKPLFSRSGLWLC